MKNKRKKYIDEIMVSCKKMIWVQNAPVMQCMNETMVRFAPEGILDAS